MAPILSPALDVVKKAAATTQEIAEALVYSTRTWDAAGEEV